MKKITLLASTVLMATAICGSAYAAPLQDYSTGKIAVDLGVNMPSSIDYADHDCDDSNSVYAGATLGLGNNMALNYKWNSYDAEHFDTDTHQLNLMYKFAPGLSAYIGYLHSDTSSYIGASQDSAQVGLSASYDIPALFTVWGNIGVGTNNSGYELGISKAITDNVELNASYYNQKIDGALKFDDHEGDMKAKGVNLGVTLKF